MTPPIDNPVVLALRAYVRLCESGTEEKITAATTRLQSVSTVVEDPVDARTYLAGLRGSMVFTRSWEQLVAECRSYLRGHPGHAVAAISVLKLP